MSVLSRYLLKEYFKILGLCLIVFYTIYILIDFLENIDNFIEAGASSGTMLAFFLFKSPYILVQMTPVATFIAAIILFSILRRNNEAMALRASGSSVFRLASPILGASFFIALGLFVFSEGVVPHTSSKSNMIWSVEVNKHDSGRFYGNNQIWYRGENTVYWAEHFDNVTKTLASPSLYFFDEAFHLVKKVDAGTATWTDGRWLLENGVLQERMPDGEYSLRRFDELRLDLPETPETFIRGEKRPEEMSYWQLRSYAQKVRQEGYDETRYLVDLHIKLALPLIGLLLVLTGIPLALGLRKGGAPLAVSAGMGVCLLCMFLLGISRSLGLSGALPPFLSGWIANIVFLFLGIYMMMRVER